jgi:hypothetical protein
MREIRLSGSEGGGFELNRFSLPLSLSECPVIYGALHQVYAFQNQVANTCGRPASAVGQLGFKVSDDGGPTLTTDCGGVRLFKPCGDPPDFQALLLLATCGRRNAIQPGDGHGAWRNS